MLNLLICKAKNKVRWELPYVSFDLFIQSPGRHTVNSSQVSIQNHPPAADCKDLALDMLNGDYLFANFILGGSLIHDIWID